MKGYHKDAFPNWMKDFRRKIEPVIGHLVGQFNLTKIRSYNPFQFMSRFVQKLLAYNVARKWLNFNGVYSLELSQPYLGARAGAGDIKNSILRYTIRQILLDSPLVL